MFDFKRIESDSGLELDCRWLRSFKLGSVALFETVRLVAYREGEPARIIYFRSAALDEDRQKRSASGGIVGYLLSVLWMLVYLLLMRLEKEKTILDAESEEGWHGRWPFAAERLPSVRRNKLLEKLGI